jgi:Putative prokaryotic signal transducing protein
LKKVYIAKNPADAHLLKGLLEGENIEAKVRGEFLYGVRGEVPITPDTCPSVWVMDDSDYDKALELVSTFREGESPNPIEVEAWRCSCGEENESQFTECWSCGKARPI